MKSVENRFFTIYFYDLWHGNTGVKRGYRWLQGVTGGYKGLQGVKGVTKGYRELQGVKRGYKGWHGVTRRYRELQRIIKSLFLTRTFPDTFSWSFLHKNQSWRNFENFWNRWFCFSERLFCYINRRKSCFHDLFSRSMTWEYRGLRRVTGLTGGIRGYMGLQGVTIA